MNTATSECAGALRLGADEVHCWCIRLDTLAEARASLYATLSVDERERSARFRFPRDRDHYIVAHGALRDLLARYLRIRSHHVAYVYNRFGKPDLAPACRSRLRFNLTHAGRLALIAIAAESSVGVDLEYIRWRFDYAELAGRFFSAAEVDQLSALPGHCYAEAFISCWTKKEAYLKAGGVGLAMPLNGFAVPLTTDPAQGPVELHVASDLVAAMRCSVYTLRPAAGYVGALAIEGRGWRLSQRDWAMLEGAGGTA